MSRRHVDTPLKSCDNMTLEGDIANISIFNTRDNKYYQVVKWWGTHDIFNSDNDIRFIVNGIVLK